MLRLLLGLAATATMAAGPNVYDFSLVALDGSLFHLSTLKGKVTLIVNLADRTEFSDQIEPLEKLYQQFKDQGFAVVGVPSNDFGKAQPEPDKDLKVIYIDKYHVTFPVVGKAVIRGKGQVALFEYLTDSKINKKTGGEVPWNFCKYLVDKSGKVVKRFDPDLVPSDPELIVAIEKTLAAKATPDKKQAKEDDEKEESKPKPSEDPRREPR